MHVYLCVPRSIVSHTHTFDTHIQPPPQTTHQQTIQLSTHRSTSTTQQQNPTSHLSTTNHTQGQHHHLNHHTYFFYNTSHTPKSIAHRSSTSSSSTQPQHPDVVHSQRMARALAVLERMVGQNAQDEVFHDCRFWEDPSDGFKVGLLGGLICGCGCR